MTKLHYDRKSKVIKSQYVGLNFKCFFEMINQAKLLLDHSSLVLGRLNVKPAKFLKVVGIRLDLRSRCHLQELMSHHRLLLGDRRLRRKVCP